MHADRSRRQPEHRHGHRLFVPRRRGRGSASRHGWVPLLSVCTGPSLCLRQAHTRSHQHLEPLFGGACQLGTEVLGGGTGCIGTPAELRESLRTFQDAGVDQTIFIQQGGKNRHEHICEALELFAAEVMPEFRENEAEREARKLAELGPAIEAAFARKRAMPSPPDSEIPTYQAYGTTIALTEADIAKLPEANRRRVLTFRRIAEIAERA